MWAPLQHLGLAQQVGAGLLLLLAAAATGQWTIERLTRAKHGPAAQRKLRPKGTLPVLYNTLQAVEHNDRFFDWVTEQSERFGATPFWFRILGVQDIAFVSTVEHFEDVLKTHFEAFDKGPRMNEILEDLLGAGIFGVDGHKWVHQRKTASNLFSLRALRESMTESVHKHARVLNAIFERSARANEPLDVFRLLNRFTIEAFAEIGFGVELGSLETDEEHPFQAAFDAAQRVLFTRFMRPRFVWKTQRALGLGREGELKQHIKTIDDMVLGIISQALKNRNALAQTARDADASSKKDIVSLFLDNVSHDAGGEFDPGFLRDIVVNFLIAGRDTTAQALSWFFYMLSQHPDVEETIRAELASKLPELCDGRISTPSMEQTSDLVYLEAALRETLRLYPSVPSNIKFANRDVVLSDGTQIRKGESVNISTYALARMKRVWGEDAREFNPQRWIDPRTGKLVQVSAFKFPSFHAGPRTCLGMNLAMMEMKIVGAMVLSRFHLALEPGQTITYDISLTHPMKGALMMRVEQL